ncbi:MAG: endonuclease domain-containing protein [Proteobacteria bacterium]|nr:endonuclease domain-containing protein [Pseudomonadota bacterium]
MKITYNPKLKALSRELRKQGVLSEVLLWAHLNGRKMKGYQFTRQKPIGNYIVDFYCSKLKLVIEIDGESHDRKFLHDKKRQQALESEDLTVLRFNDNDVNKDIESVLMAIEGWIEKSMKKGQPPGPLC